MSNIVTINGVQSARITYKDRTVCTTQQLAQFYRCDPGNIQDNHANNRDRFEEGKHFVFLEGDALKLFKQGLPAEIREPLKFAPKVILWTEMGAARHAKMLTTDKAWDVFEEMEEAYFRAAPRRRLQSVSPIKLVSDAARAFPALYKVARLIGCDQNAAAISANQAVAKFANVNLLEGLGQKHLEAANQESKYWTPTELGLRIGQSAQVINKALATVGLQVKRGKDWDLTDAGKSHARLFDTGKKHNSGVPVAQIKWADTVMDILFPRKAA